MTTPAMLIRGQRYVEAQSTDPKHMHGCCSQCAFYADTEGCRTANLAGVARAAFGGDCIQRDVVYAKEQA